MHLLGSERPWQRRLLEFVLLLVLAFVFEMALTLVLAGTWASISKCSLCCVRCRCRRPRRKRCFAGRCRS